MTNYREILRLLSQGISQRSVSVSCGCSRSTVQRTIARAEECGLTWPLPPEMTDEKLRKVFAPHGTAAPSPYHKEPDFEAVHREMSKSGVTLSLLWNEYSAECRKNGERINPLLRALSALFPLGFSPRCATGDFSPCGNSTRLSLRNGQV